MELKGVSEAKTSSGRKTMFIKELKKANFNGLVGDQLRAVEQEVDRLLLNDEIHWIQRSRPIWLAVGDKNTKFFHQFASHSRKKN